jgi:hypothetical protein
MSSKYSLVYDAKITQALAPAADAAGRNGAWVDTFNADKMFVVVDVNQGDAAAPVTLTFQQAQDVSGTGAKAPSGAAFIWANLNQSASDTLVPQAAGTSFTLPGAAASMKIAFEIPLASFLDVTNSYRTLRVITSASNAANITAANYFGTPLRFSQQNPPSGLT